MSGRGFNSGRAWIKRVVQEGLSARSVGLQSEEIAKIVLAESMAEKRRLIRKRSGGIGGDPRQTAAINRFAKDRARSFKKEVVAKKGKTKLDKTTLLRNRAPSPLLDRLDPSRSESWKRLIARKYKANYPRLVLKDFNFLDNPIGTMELLQTLSQIDRSEVNAYIDFDDDYCLDIGAYLVIAEVWHELSPIFHGGRMSSPIQKVLDAVGLRRELRIGLNDVKNHDDVWPFELWRRRTRGTTTAADALLKPQGREHLNDKLIDVIDEWLQVASLNATSDGALWELSADGKFNIANMVGEILDNAERHSSIDGDGDWTMAAFMAKRNAQGRASSMRCYLAFLSVGNSIAETIERAPKTTKEFCDKYARLHVRPGLSRDTLRTIAALQDGVTSAHSAYKGQRGGTGLQDTLAFIGELGGAPKPEADVRVTIVSGSSCIQLRHPILVGRPDGSDRRVQWCNEANDPGRPPDRDIAFDLPSHFAGTLVSVAFTMDPSLFVPEGDEDGQSND